MWFINTRLYARPFAQTISVFCQFVIYMYIHAENITKQTIEMWFYRVVTVCCNDVINILSMFCQMCRICTHNFALVFLRGIACLARFTILLHLTLRPMKVSDWPIGNCRRAHYGNATQNYCVSVFLRANLFGWYWPLDKSRHTCISIKRLYAKECSIVSFVSEIKCVFAHGFAIPMVGLMSPDKQSFIFFEDSQGLHLFALLNLNLENYDLTVHWQNF